MLQSHQNFDLVLAVKLLKIMLRNWCWPTTFHTITARLTVSEVADVMSPSQLAPLKQNSTRHNVSPVTARHSPSLLRSAPSVLQSTLVCLVRSSISPTCSLTTCCIRGQSLCFEDTAHSSWIWTLEAQMLTLETFVGFGWSLCMFSICQHDGHCDCLGRIM